MSISHLLTTYGYFAVFALVALESLGIPLPGETILIAAGTYAGTSHKLSVWVIFIVAAAGAVIGDNIGYGIGRTGGYRLVRRYGSLVRFDESKVKVARYIFDRYGGKVVFFGRFVSVFRTYVAFLAGTLKMRWHRFLVNNACGGILWAATFSFASYAAGHALARASKIFTYVAIAAAAIAIVVAFLVMRRQSRRLTARANATYPGPLDDR
ncbi:MAG TPA: DedA family protein [Acidimicrobiales bacterium]|jgi:membrane protein DedA with SNARE-associated domain